MLCSGSAVLSISLWSMFAHKDKHDSGQQNVVDGSCNDTAPQSRGVVWISFLFHDSLNFGLTVWKSWSVWKQHGIKRTDVPLLTLMVRDGVMYYAMVCGGYLSNTITYYVLSENLRGSLSSFAGCIAVTITSRIYFNLYKTAEVNHSGRQHHHTLDRETAGGKSTQPTGPGMMSTGSDVVELTTFWADEIVASLSGPGGSERRDGKVKGVDGSEVVVRAVV
ncbi:hypothetical protein K435DRAFT_419445 [Dendrothele bispora CBS 962.96]|uniref:Uncharacterized protein n=1 Tax=Dendrothele bispora (strain CBS 962.96) TaxID=1314807 RepID=A0A4V6T530_DENBC|nr:hypothetical protein K435DRAFT_419445 [Dendrothele bispora CBS 962.96]